MKKLPKIYQNPLEKKIKNNKELCKISFEREEESTSKSITEEIRSIFNGLGYSYNIPVIIKTKDKTYETSLIAHTKNYIVTLDNDVILISDISSIKRKNP